MDRKRILGLDIGTNSIGWALINRVNEDADWVWQELEVDDGTLVERSFEPDPNKNHIIDCGSRIFTEGIDNLGQGEKESSKNESRRVARGIRRQYYRRRLRKNQLLKWLATHHLRPEKGTNEWQEWLNLNPYLLRRKALTEALTAYEFGRVLFNLAQQRGFKSNRKTGKTNEDAGTLEKGAKDGSMLGFSDAVVKMAQLNLPTIGAYFAHLVEEFQAQLSKKGAQTAEEFKEVVRIRARYTKRQWFIDEFDAIWKAQTELQPAASALKALFENEDARVEVRDRIIYFQRPLRSMKEMIGKCQFEVEEQRANAAHPDVQLSRLLQELNSIEIYPANNQIDGRRRLTAEERKILIEYAASHEELLLGERVSEAKSKKGSKKAKAATGSDAAEIVSVEAAPKSAKDIENDAMKEYKKSVFFKELGLKDEVWYCNLSSKKRLKGLKTIVELSKALGEGEIKEGKEIYAALSDEQKERLFELVLNEDDPEVLKAELTSEFGFDDNQAEALTKVSLEEGYSSLSLKATRNILPYLLEGQLYNDAQTAAGYHHALPDDPDRVLLDALPAFYWPGKDNDSGEGKVEVIRNPIVQKAMYELRRLVNAIIRKYGRPDMICIELARDLKGNSEDRKKWSDLRDANFDKNEAGRTKILEIFHKHGIKKENPSRRDLEKYHLWQQQNERCIYSGRSISVEQLFKDGVIEVDHIFPYSRSQNDKPFNKVVCYKDENAAKSGQSPFEWLQGNPTKMAAVKKLVQECHWPEFKKQNFFAEQFAEKEEFSDKQLNDTKYAARFALAYLKLVCKDVVAVKGGVTAELRQMWGLQDGKKHENGHNPLVLSNVFLNDLELAKEEWKKSGSKSRLDHRHHTVDAIVIACTTRSAIQKISTYRRKFGNLPSADRDENKKLIAERRKTPVFPQPWVGFTDDVKDRVRDVVISFAKKNPYQPQGALHEETYYGRLEAHDNLRNEEKLRVDKGEVYTTRKAIHSLKAPMIDKVADPRIRKMFYDRLAANGMLDENGVIIKLSDKDWEKRWKAILEKPFIHTNGLAIKKVRIRVPSSNIREIRPGKFAEPGSNHHYAFYAVAAPVKKSKGKTVAVAPDDWKIEGEIVTLFDAAKRKVQGKPVIDKAPNDPERRFLFSLMMNDMVLIARDESHYVKLMGFDFSNKKRYHELFDYVYRVQKMSKTKSDGPDISFRHHSMTKPKLNVIHRDEDGVKSVKESDGIGLERISSYSRMALVIKLKCDELGYLSIAKS